MALHVYADQNFLINCIKDKSWQYTLNMAHNSGRISLVLSPWHFFEYGKAARHLDSAELLRFTEELQPKWIMERADLQLFEFWVVWNQLWSSSKDVVEPIGTLIEIAAILSKVNQTRLLGITMRDYVNQFAKDEGRTEVETALNQHRSISQSIRAEYERRKERARFEAATGTRSPILNARWEGLLRLSRSHF